MDTISALNEICEILTRDTLSPATARDALDHSGNAWSARRASSSPPMTTPSRIMWRSTSRLRSDGTRGGVSLRLMRRRHRDVVGIGLIASGTIVFAEASSGGTSSSISRRPRGGDSVALALAWNLEHAGDTASIETSSADSPAPDAAELGDLGRLASSAYERHSEIAHGSSATPKCGDR
jgi:hypothetical protein